MSDALHLRREESDHKGRLLLERDGRVLAEMTYSRASPTLVIVDHTEVDPSLKGEGAGRRLFHGLVDWARIDGQKVIPLCPFTKAEFGKHPETSDVLG